MFKLFERYPNIKPLVKAFVSCDDVKENKPNPAVYLECAKRLGVDIKDCCIVEDTIVGLEGARAAGCDVVLALTDQKKRE